MPWNGELHINYRFLSITVTCRKEYTDKLEAQTRIAVTSQNTIKFDIVRSSVDRNGTVVGLYLKIIALGLANYNTIIALTVLSSVVKVHLRDTLI